MDYTYDEITQEYKRLGFTYPKDDEFSDEEIADMMAKQHAADDQNVQVVTMTGNSHSPEVLKAFAQLGTALGTNHRIGVGYQSLIIVRPMTVIELRNSAIGVLKSAKHQQDREVALNSLRDIKLGIGEEIPA